MSENRADASRFDVVFLFAVPWHSYRQRSHHLARLLSLHHRVLYVEQITRRRESIGPSRLRWVEPNVWVVNIPFMLQPAHRTPLKRLETGVFIRFLRTLLRVLDFQNTIVIHCDYFSSGFVGRLGQALDVYDCLDDHAAFSWSNSATKELEDELTRKCDLVFAVSEELAHDRRAMCPRTYLLPNAVEMSRFMNAMSGSLDKPEDMSGIPRPILGFVGSLYDWIDYSLLRRLAKDHPEWHIVLLGPIRTDIEEIRGVENIHLLGERPYTSLPTYIASFDVGLVPFRVNRLTQHADVIKVYEYLATGIPVVGADLPSLRRFGECVRIGTDHDAFEAQVLDALKDDSEEATKRRRNAVLHEDWTERVRLAERILYERLKGRSKDS